MTQNELDLDLWKLSKSISDLSESIYKRLRIGQCADELQDNLITSVFLYNTLKTITLSSENCLNETTGAEVTLILNKLKSQLLNV